MSLLDPVFIVSPTGKCGTNFLMNTLFELGMIKIPDHPILSKEDYLLYHAEFLSIYAEQTAQVWTRWPIEENIIHQNRDAILKNIGDGILNFIGRSSDVPVAVKTPCTKNIDLVGRLFPDTKFIFIVRDGRDVTHSAVLSGYWESHSKAFYEWAKHTRFLLDFIDDNKAGFERGIYQLIKYEDLYQRSEIEITKLIDIFAAECTVSDAIAVMNSLPVYGSSDYGVKKSGEFSWEIASKTKDFKPIARWRCWDTDTVNEFKSMAGKELIDLGYEADNSW